MISIAKTILKFIAETIFKLISLLNLHYTFLVGLVGLVLYVVGVLPANATISLIFKICLVVSVAYAIIATVWKMIRPKTPRIEKSKEVEQMERESGVQKKAEKSASVLAPQTEKPTYYRVTQNPNYIMAEFSDRYELYYEYRSKLKHYRTDYKSNIPQQPMQQPQPMYNNGYNNTPYQNYQNGYQNNQQYYNNNSNNGGIF